MQAAARMLWAAVEHASTEPRSYSAFLAKLYRILPRKVLRLLTPLVVQYFVHTGLDLEEHASSLMVWVWDEVSAVPAAAPAPGGQVQATFLQQHLSAVIGSRRAALQDKHIIDVMLVPTVASTQGSAVRLAPTASRNVGWHDLRLPVIQDQQQV